MEYKKLFIDVTNELIYISKKTNISKMLADNLIELNSYIESFKVKVPLMGKFNAGKSSLINKYLDINYLPTSLLATTAIAAEIKFGADEMIIAHNKKGGKKNFKIDQISQISNENYDYIEVYINSPLLKAMEDIIIVDMPGIDSENEIHNQAILSYVDDGTYYIILIEAPEGGIKESVINFMKELNIYEIDFAVLVSKSEKETEQNLNLIVDTVRTQVSDAIGRDVITGSVSSHNHKFSDFIKIIKNIDYESVLVRNFKPRLIDIINKVNREIYLKKTFTFAETSEIDKKKYEMNKELIRTEDSINSEKIRIEKEFKYTTVDKIIKEIVGELKNNTDLLRIKAKESNDEFLKTVNEILRPVLKQSIEKNASIVFNDSFKNIYSEFGEILKDVFISSDIKANTKFTNFLTICTDIISYMKSSSGRWVLGSIGTAVGSAAGGVGAPIGGLIGAVLPDILALLKLPFDEDMFINKNIENDFLPDFKKKLKERLNDMLGKLKNNFIARMKEIINNNIKEFTEALGQIKIEKEKIKSNHDEYLGELDRQIDIVQKIKGKILDLGRN
ncbi:MAG: hypothetical protein ACD_59C00049G0002 [uncultured bacterium]|nr:MAG: hypothetical protein ACD_59C00049G0002 [uncultured bacterium]